MKCEQEVETEQSSRTPNNVWHELHIVLET